MGKLLLLVVFISSIGCLYSENIATGATHTFHPSVQGKIETIDWRHNGSLVVEWDKTGTHWYRYQDRASLNDVTGDFTLQVKKNDNGLFKGQFQVAGSLQYFERIIKVIDPVPVPKVTFKVNSTDITLLCSLDPPVQAEFKWTGPNGFSHVGNSVNIIRNKDKDLNKDIYFCTAKNEVSEKGTEFRLKDNLIEPDDSIGGGAIAAIVIGILLVVIAAVVVIAAIIWKFFINRAPAGTRGEMENLGGAGQSEPNQSTEKETSENHNSAGANADKESPKANIIYFNKD